ncbi:MAG: hypothetical protein AB1656_24460 [Candidatus Omnitrophota bacterium]
MRHSFWSFKGIAGTICAVAAAAIVFAGYQAHQKARYITLFDGPYQICPRETPHYYPSLDYNFSEYGEEEAEPWGQKEGRIEGATPATTPSKAESAQALQLRLPTVYRDRRPYRSLQILCPEDGAYYPPNLCEPFIKWEDPANNFWLIEIEFGEKPEKLSFLCREKQWRFPSALWKSLRNDAVDRDARLQIKGIRIGADGKRTETIQASKTVRFRIAQEPADNFIVYRVVVPPFSSKKTPDIRIRDIRTDREECLLSAHRQYCINCHTFSDKQGNRGKLGLQIRSLSGANQSGKTPDLRMYLAIFDMDEKLGFKAQLPFVVQMSTFMAWSPGGDKLAYSANQKLATLSPVTFETQHASTVTSDIAIYDLSQSVTYLLPEASDPDWLENYPCWSPDGRKFVFARAPTGQHPATLRYDLFAIREEEGEHKASPIAGASNNGHSNYFPRFSPNGKWMSFCQCDGGDLIRSSSDIYILDGELNGPPRRLEFNTENSADSWHSWSSNSRWLVFVSKRRDGAFASLYLSRIGDEGRASPAIPLPIENEPLASYNIPEFIANAPAAQENELYGAIRVEQPPRVIREIDGRSAAPIVHP